MPQTRLRLLILIVAYNAEDTLCAVLERIPASVVSDFECEVLVIDDASPDSTFQRGLEYRQSRPDLPLSVLRNDRNQQYGGNQKVGYRYAIEEGFDLVALVHGDGQYAPEDLPRLLEPLAAGTADAVFGSRMMVTGAALRGGMPLYKFVGNKILTAAQNRLTGASLSEWHSGYRLYRVETLSQLRFTANSDDFCFDTEIILQLLNADARIAELPIPTYYGDEICRVEGLKYAAQVVRASVHSALHRSGLMHRRTLSPITPNDNSRYDVKLGYPSSHSEALNRVTPGSRVMDLGAGPGAFATALADRGAQVSTADLHSPRVCDPRITAHTVDLNRGPAVPMDGIDQVLMLDVIEHLADPESFMSQLRYELRDRPREVILTTPNIAFIVTRLMLLMGQFNYGVTGILDRTHTRLFTFRTIRTLMREAGFEVEEIRGIPAPFPKAVRSRWLGMALLNVNRALICLAPRMFSYQILVRATSRPHVDHVLAGTRTSSARYAA